MSFLCWRPTTLSLVTVLGAGTAWSLNPEKIYEQAAPSVVHLKSIDSKGSGIFIHKNGWILTNLHVVASGTPVTVTFPGPEGEAVARFDGARLERVHPSLDMAILKIDPGRKKLKVARVATAKEKTKPGAACFAISSPGGVEEALTNTITQGIVSTNRRRIEGQDYIQFSAAINAGSSGGALLDSSARVVGLITAKQGGGEGVGFAIPIAGIDWKVFGKLSERKGDRARFDQCMQIAARARLAGTLAVIADPGGPLPEPLAIAAYHSRTALTEFPTDEAAFRSLIEVYYLAGKQDICAALAKRGGEVTGSPVFTTLEARSLQLMGKVEGAKKLYLQALAREDDKPSPTAAAALARLHAKDSDVDWPRVAYLARWGLVSLSEKRRGERRQLAKLLEEAYGNLPESAARALALKTKGFTMMELSDFPKKPLAAPEGSEELLRAFDPEFYEPILAGSKVPLKIPKELLPEKPKDDTKDHYYNLPAPPDYFVPLSGGRAGLLVTEQAETVQLFDLAVGDVIGTHKFKAGTLKRSVVIGGLKNWALVDKKTFRIERFAMWEKGSRKITPTKGPIPWDVFGAVMSPYRDDFAWILRRIGERTVTPLIFHFGTGTIHTPDASAIRDDELQRWAHSTKRGFAVNRAGTTLGPGGGGPTIATLEAVSLRLRPLKGAYASQSFALENLDSGQPVMLDQRSVKYLKNENYVNNHWDQGGNGLVGSPLAMVPVHGSRYLIQILSRKNLMIQVLDRETGKPVLPIQELQYAVPRLDRKFHMSGKTRFRVLSHISSPRVAILDAQASTLISARINFWPWLTTTNSPLELRRPGSEEFRVPFKIAKGSKLLSRPKLREGIEIDQEKGEIVITNPERHPFRPSQTFYVEVESEKGLKTIFPFTLISESKNKAQNETKPNN